MYGELPRITCPDSVTEMCHRLISASQYNLKMLLVKRTYSVGKSAATWMLDFVMV